MTFRSGRSKSISLGFLRDFACWPRSGQCANSAGEVRANGFELLHDLNRKRDSPANMKSLGVIVVVLCSTLPLSATARYGDLYDVPYGSVSSATGFAAVTIQCGVP